MLVFKKPNGMALVIEREGCPPWVATRINETDINGQLTWVPGAKPWDDDPDERFVLVSGAEAEELHSRARNARYIAYMMAHKPKFFVPMSINPRFYTVSSWDNGEMYSDHDGPGLKGSYATKEQAIEIAKAIVDSSLTQLLETNPGMDKSTSDALYDSWREWGVSPSISSDPPGTPVDFSSSTYAMMASARIILALLDKADAEANDIDRTG